MNAIKIMKEIENLHYWDARVIKLECSYFADEAYIVYDDSEGNVFYKFTNCYKVTFEHSTKYEKQTPYKSLTYGQIPYFIQDVSVTEVCIDNISLYKCIISMPPMLAEIYCKDIIVGREP